MARVRNRKGRFIQVPPMAFLDGDLWVYCSCEAAKHAEALGKQVTTGPKAYKLNESRGYKPLLLSIRGHLKRFPGRVPARRTKHKLPQEGFTAPTMKGKT